MVYLSIVVAAAVAWVFGAGWYMMLSKQWIAASGVKMGGEGTGSPLPFVMSALLLVLVAGMMRYVFELAEITAIFPGALLGGGLGLFVAAPWIAMNNLYAGRPEVLTAIDGGYAIIGCALIGAVLVLF